MVDTRDPSRRPAWISVHVFHRGDLDDVLVDAVGPLVDELTASDALASWFFLRYWEGGPHLRVRVRPRTTALADDVRTAILERCGSYLADHALPEATVAAINAYRVAAEQMARAERLVDYDRSVRAVSSVELVDYRPEGSAFGGGRTLAAVESHFEESSSLALHLLRAGLPPARRRAVGLGMLMLSLAVCEPDLARAAVTLRSQCPVAPIGPAGQQVRAQARRMWAVANGTARCRIGHELTSWMRSVRMLHDQLVAAFRIGSFAPTDVTSPLGRLAACTPLETRPVAETVLRCTHLFLNRLGIHGYAELLIAGMVAGALTHPDEEG